MNKMPTTAMNRKLFKWQLLLNPVANFIWTSQECCLGDFTKIATLKQDGRQTEKNKRI